MIGRIARQLIRAADWHPRDQVPGRTTGFTPEQIAETPERIRFDVTLEIDHRHSEVSPETEIDSFLAELALLLQRKPHGWGATVIAEIE